MEEDPTAGNLVQPRVSIRSTLPNSSILPRWLSVYCTTLRKGGRIQACHQNFKPNFKGTTTIVTGEVQQPRHTEKAKELA